MKTSIWGEEIEDIKIDVHFEKSSGELKKSPLDGTTQTTITLH